MTTPYEGLSNEQLRSAILERDDQLRKSMQRVVELESELVREQEDHQALVNEAQKVEGVRLEKLTHYESALKEANVALNGFVKTWFEANPVQRLLVFEPSVNECKDALATINKVLESK